MLQPLAIISHRQRKKMIKVLNPVIQKCQELQILIKLTSIPKTLEDHKRLKKKQAKNYKLLTLKNLKMILIFWRKRMNGQPFINIIGILIYLLN